MDLSQLATAIGIITSIIGAVKWIISKLEKILKDFIISETALLNQRLINSHFLIASLQKKIDEMLVEQKEMRTLQTSQRIMLGEISAELRVTMSEHSTILKTLQKNSTEWIDENYVRIKGGRRE